MRTSLLASVCMGLVQAYRLVISPLLPPACRFHPTCSRYALGALHEFGALRGSLLALLRLLKCHPLHPGGFDPVPQRGITARPTTH